MVPIDGRMGGRPAMRKPEFPGFGHAGEPALASENALHRWSDRDGAYKPRSPAQLARSASDASAYNPYRTQYSFSSLGSGTDPTAGRPRNGSSPSTIDQANSDKRVLSGSANTRKWEGRNYKQYHIPIHRENSPASSPTNNSYGIATPVLSPLSDPGHRYRASEIGIALGSPIHPPESPEMLWQPQAMTSGTQAGSAGGNNTSGLTRTRSKKWNPFSRSRSKRSKPQEDANTQMLGTSIANNGQFGGTIVSVQSEVAPRHRGRVGSEGDSKKTSRHKPIVVPQTEPERIGLVSSEPLNGGIPRSLVKDATPMSSQWGEQTTMPKVHEHLAVPYLNVEIPSVEMERYSVMFSSLLQRQQSASLPTSLPARRQVKLEKLTVPKAEDFRENAAITAAAVGLPRPRRATSPLPKSSPTFSLFPNDNKPTANGSKPSPRMRSNTSPAMLDFPPSATLQVQETAKPKPNATVSPSRSTSVKVESSTNQAQRDRLISKYSSRKESAPELGAATMSSRGQSDSPSTSLNARPAFKTPNWQPTRPEDPSSHSQSIKRRSPLSPHVEEETCHKNMSPGDDPAKNALNEAVKISIARQISISRQQRRMLVPMNHTPRGRANSATDAAMRVAVGEGKRLAETSRSMPMVVNPDNDGGSPRSMHRKSSRVVVEEVGEKKRLVETNRSMPKVVHPDDDSDTSQKMHRKSSRVVLEGM